MLGNKGKRRNALTLVGLEPVHIHIHIVKAQEVHGKGCKLKKTLFGELGGGGGGGIYA